MIRLKCAIVAVTGAAVVGLFGGLFAHADGGEAPLTRVRDVLLVSAYVNDVGPYPFVVDPAVGSVVLHADVATYLGLGVSDGVSGESAAVVDSFHVGGQVLLTGASVVVMDLSGFQGRLGQRVAGVMPAWFSDREITLDLAAGRAIVSEAPGPPYAPGPAAAPGALTVRGLVNGRHLRSFVVDPTFGGVVAMSEAGLREIGALRDDTPQLTVAATGAREEDDPLPDGSTEPVGRRQIRLRNLRIQGLEIQEPACAVLAAGAQARVGLGVLRHFHVSFWAVAQEHRLRLERISATPQRDPPVAGYGVSPGEFRDGWWHVFVAEGSPAARAGVVTGDRLVALDGERVLDQPFDELVARLAAAPGDEAKLDIEHGEQIRTVRLTAEPLL